MAESGSTVVRRQLGRRLRRLREDAGKTIRSVQDARLFSESKVARIEAGRVPVRVGDVWTLCRFYNASNEVTDALAALADGTTNDGWWEEYADPAVLPEWFGLYLGLEGSADTISTYHPELINGLVQTEDYARAVILTDGPLDEDVLAGRLRVRANRQRAVLGNARKRLRMIVGPGALSLVIGSPDVMADQIRHLRDLDASGAVDIRVIPPSSGVHAGFNGPFTVMDFDDPADPSVVYLEFLMGARYLEQDRQVAAYRHTFQRLHEQAQSIKENR
jgi:transcriptional regulator with XRE-family HTH domain